MLDSLPPARDRTTLIRIVGVGSPFGDDAAGLEAARQLAEAPPPGCEIIAVDRPGAGLIELLSGAEAAIVIDAVRSGAPAGTLHDLDLHDLEDERLRPISSHDLGVVAAVRLAIRLGRAPARGRVLGIEAAPGAAPGPGGMTPVAREAVGRAVRRARRWADRLSRAPRNPTPTHREP